MTEHRDAGIDRMGARQGGAAAHAGLPFALVDQELELEGALPAGAGPVVANGGALRADRGRADPALTADAGLDGSIRAANSASLA